MPTVRAFIAIDLSDEARTALARLQNRLKPAVPRHSVRWSAPQNIHLTLHFLGDTEIGLLDKICAVLEDTALAHQSFELAAGGLGCFPNIKRPRVVWVGVLRDTETLSALHRNLGIRLKKAIGFSPDTRPYSAHLTLGRVKKGIPSRQLQQLSQALQQEQANAVQLAQLQVTEINLIKSELKPTGPVYTRLSTGRLNPA